MLEALGLSTIFLFTVEACLKTFTPRIWHTALGVDRSYEVKYNS